MNNIETQVRTCKTCGSIKALGFFPKDRFVCQSCKYRKEKAKWSNDSVKINSKKEYMSEYYKINNHVNKIRSYRTQDKKHGRETISVTEGRKLLENGICYYCSNDNLRELGFDRIDNNKGHSIDNILVCCEKCNNILGDLPQQAKEIMKQSLAQIHKEGVLKSWTIPTKRKKL